MDIAEPTNFIPISEYIAKAQITFLKENTSRDQALITLTESLFDVDSVNEIKQFHQAILQRERIVSTGIGMGVAIPHAKSSQYQDFFIAIGIQPIKGIDWDALDHLPVHLIFMIGGPANQQGEYLAILSSITRLVREQHLREALIHAKTSDAVLRLIKQSEHTVLQNI